MEIRAGPQGLIFLQRNQKVRKNVEEILLPRKEKQNKWSY